MGCCPAQCKMLLFCAKTVMKEPHKFLTSPSEEGEDRRKTFQILASFQFNTLRCFFVPQDMLLVMKTLEDEWYVNIKAYKFTVFEILRDSLYCQILLVQAIIQSTDSI